MPWLAQQEGLSFDSELDFYVWTLLVLPVAA